MIPITIPAQFNFVNYDSSKNSSDFGIGSNSGIRLMHHCCRRITNREGQKDVPGGFPKSDLLGVTVTLIHVAGQRFLAVWQSALQLRNKSVTSQLWQKMAHTPSDIL